MPLFSMPMVLLVEADSVQEAQDAIDIWHDDLDIDMLPDGTDSIDHSPTIEVVDGQRLIYLPSEEEVDEDEDSEKLEDDDDEDDSFGSDDD